MAETNHSALGRGLKLYTDSMRVYLRERLLASHRGQWWEQGVLGALTDIQRRNLARAAQDNPDAKSTDLIDPGHMVRIVTRNFDTAFEVVFHNFKQTQSWLLQAEQARNNWAHSRSGDLPADEVGFALYAMERLLSTAKLPEATDLETIRKSVLGIADPSAEPASPRHVQPAQSGDLPYWWQVCTPRTGFQNPNNVDESLFAATLGGVFAGSARDEYLDPAAFLSQTYFTENLTQMVRDVVSRMSGGEGPAVTEVQTPFGGGKTHALLTLYHMINSSDQAAAIPNVADALGDLSVPSNARVLVFDGQEAGTEPAEKEDGASVHTLWGELAHQVDPATYMRHIIDCDGRREAPGNAVFRQVLEEASPCLILLDELVSYLVKLRYSTARRTQNLYRQTIQFLQETLQLASNVPGVCVLLSLPQSRREFGGLEPEQLHREMGILDELQPRADRVVSKRTPINDEEIYLLMTRRLFESVDSDAAERVARAYRGVYDRTPGLYDAAVTTQDFIEQQVMAYPLHPELIDVLYKKWSTAPDFPRTRATLQLLASIVADQWANQRQVYSIQSAHVDLDRERIRTRVVSAAGSGGGYDGVVRADIIGGDAHADMQDQSRGGDYARHRIARGVATTLLMNSFGGQERSGANAQQLRLGTVAPNVGPEYVTEILNTLEEVLWYVHKEGESLRFQTRPNIYRAIADTASNQSSSSVADRLRSEVDKVIGTAAGFRILPWAGGDGQIPDNPEPSIVVLPPRFAVADPNGGAGLADASAVEEIWDRVGGGLRQWRNSLILVAPDRELWGRAEEAVREVLAYDAVVAPSAGSRFDLSETEFRDLRSRRDAKADSLRTSVATAYRWVFYPDETGLAILGLPVPATSNERIADRVVKRLSDQDYGTPKILPRMGAVYFNARVGPQIWKDDSDALDLSEALRRFPQWTFLPILPNREETLLASIREGIGQGLWGVAIGEMSSFTFQDLIETPADLDKFGTLFDGSASLVKGALLDLVREEVRPTPPEEPDTREDDSPTPVADAIHDPHPEWPPIPPTPVIPPPEKRLARVRLNLQDLAVAKTNNLQPYLFRVLQEQDAGAEINITIDVSSAAGISEDVLNARIVEAFDQLGISIDWQEG